ncbi:MAG TPA: TonB family protein [Puia sp.]|nr:TonB family protein [Puia sp.]
MEPEKIMSANLLDIVFEGRNKAYGAYELRRHHNGRVLIGLLAVAVLTASSFVIATIASRHRSAAAAPIYVTDVQLQEIEVEKSQPPPPPAPKLEPVKVAEVKFTAPRIVKDVEVKAEERPPEQEKLQDSRIGTINQQGVADSGIVAPPNVAGNGSGVIEAPKHTEENTYDKIFTKVEIESQYPGGAAAWLRFLNKNLRYPEDALNNNIQGTVMVQFIVDKLGDISSVEVVSGPDQGGLREEAVRVIKKSGQWLPAIQNGAKVKSYKRQPVVFVLASAGQ